MSARDFPCTHERDGVDALTDWVDHDFDVICPICYGHFFRHAVIAYLGFVGLFVASWFWHPLGLSKTLFIALSLFLASYVCAVLRRRPSRLLLVIVVLSSVTCLVVVQPTTGGITTSPLAWPSIAAFMLLAVAIAIGLAQGVAKILGTGVHDASPVLSLVLVASLLVTVADLAMNSAAIAVPALNSYPAYDTIRQILNLIQLHKTTAILFTVGVAVVWAGRISVTVAMEKREGSSSLNEGWPEANRLLRFFRLVLVQFFLETWKLLKNTVRHLWLAASSCARVLLLIAASWALAASLHSLAALVADIWQRDSFWLTTWQRVVTLIAGYVLSAWAAGWAVVLIALAGHERNKTHGWEEGFVHASLVGRYNLIHSTPIYWFYLSLVLFVSWFFIAALRLAIDPNTGFHVGVLFVGYLSLVITLGAGTSIVRALRSGTSDSG